MRAEARTGPWKKSTLYAEVAIGDPVGPSGPAARATQVPSVIAERIAPQRAAAWNLKAIASRRGDGRPIAGGGQRSRQADRGYCTNAESELALTRRGRAFAARTPT